MSHEGSPQLNQPEVQPPVEQISPVLTLVKPEAGYGTTPVTYGAPEEEQAPEEVEIPQADLDTLRHGAAIVMKEQFGSVSHLQRKLKIGFGQANEMMAEYERLGIVGPAPDPKDATSPQLFRDVLKGKSVDEARDTILGISKVSKSYAEALENNFPYTTSTEPEPAAPLDAPEMTGDAVEPDDTAQPAKAPAKDLRNNPANQKRTLRGLRRRSRRGNGSGGAEAAADADDNQPDTEPSIPVVIPAPRTVPPRSSAAAAPEAAAATPAATPETTPSTPDSRPATKRTIGERFKRVLEATKTAPQFVYAKMQVGFSDKDPAAYDARRHNRLKAMHYAVGAAVVAKAAISGYMIAKGLGANFGTSFADTAMEHIPKGEGGRLASFADTVTDPAPSSGNNASVPEAHGLPIETAPAVEHLTAGDTISDHALNQLHEQGNLNPTAADITAETQKYLDANHLTWEQAKQLPVGFEFVSPEAVDASVIEAPVEHLDHSGDTISHHALAQLHQAGIENPSQTQITEETNRWMAANGMSPDDPRQFHMAVGQEIINPHYVEPAAAQLPIDDAPLHPAAHHTKHIEEGVVDRELRSTETVTIAALSAMAVHQAMEDMVKDLREDEAITTAKKKKKTRAIAG